MGNSLRRAGFDRILSASRYEHSQADRGSQCLAAVFDSLMPGLAMQLSSDAPWGLTVLSVLWFVVVCCFGILFVGFSFSSPSCFQDSFNKWAHSLVLNIFV